jgi:hypothetical protein
LVSVRATVITGRYPFGRVARIPAHGHHRVNAPKANGGYFNGDAARLEGRGCRWRPRKPGRVIDLQGSNQVPPV